MSALAGKTTTGKVWHVGVSTAYVSLCNQPLDADRGVRDLAAVPAYRLCQHCERAVEQIAAAVAEVQR